MYMNNLYAENDDPVGLLVTCMYMCTVDWKIFCVKDVYMYIFIMLLFCSIA